MRRHGWLTMWMVTTMLACGCNKAPPPPKMTANAPADATQPASPTTQELLTGPYKRVALTPIPFFARVPQSWDNKVPEGTHLNFLEGPGPNGSQIQISLETGTHVPADLLKNVLDRAKKAADADPKKVRLFQIKPLGDMQVMEQQNFFTGADDPRQRWIDWKLTFFVHGDIDYATYIVDVLGLPEQRFDQSKELLQKIFDSITYDPTAAAPSAPTGL